MDRTLQVIIVYWISHLGLIFFTFPANIITSAYQGHWLPILIGFAMHIFVVTLYMKGLRYFGRNDIVDIFLGTNKLLAGVILIPAFAYFVFSCCVMLRSYSEIISIIFLSNTPLWAITFLILSISAYLASRGLESIFRTSILFSLMFLPLLTVVFVTSFQNSDWRYVLPLQDVDLSFFHKPRYYESFFAFTGGCVFLGFVQPYFTFRTKPVMLAALALLPFYLFAVYIPILTFGASTASTFVLPYVVAVDTVNLDWLMFDRVTVFFLLSDVTFIMMVCSLLLWQSTRLLRIGLPRVKQSYIILGISAVVFAGCVWITSWRELQHTFYWNTGLRFYTTLSIPLSVLILGYRMKRKMTLENV